MLKVLLIVFLVSYVLIRVGRIVFSLRGGRRPPPYRETVDKPPPDTPQKVKGGEYIDFEEIN